ncbi:MAG: hypothetical protein A2849_01310 [Candidatus Taylorbacteria bacterium RIFCSPHIGHO2_01_FULL_51_15]|uniref:SIS domain-containing protein n=1 Tax=Candidatus Taylorbacteria bacterium RIFCSPHIGHO2_01_FULL_51_15 TaxID=1802304 RepID=A0A1G2M940_9BACT|nr:MAG: hypothetical protein A2849_01310 [Candidatus Taylorbacteria bacterium RIFCSPHIGHO2_01_FULL_51_15]
MRQYLADIGALIETSRKDSKLQKSVGEAISLISKCFSGGGKLLIAGNGGSAADAEHFATEFVGRFMEERKARPAIALSSSSSMLTAWSNDYCFEDVFARQLEAFGKPEDIFIGISTSGNSKNLILAVEKAKILGLKSICLLGNSGGALRDMADVTIAIAERRTPHVQELQIALIHVICQEVEKAFAE